MTDNSDTTLEVNAADVEVSFAERMLLKTMPVETVTTYLNSKVTEQPELEGIINQVTSDEALTRSIANLRLNNPETLDKIMNSFTGGEEASPEALETIEAALSNDVLRGQLTQAINNVADNPNVTDANVTNLINASKDFQRVATESMGSIGGAFQVATGSHDEFNAAKAELAGAYRDMGMSQEDFDAAMEQGLIIGINSKIDGIDNFGSFSNTIIDSAMNDAGAVFTMLGLGQFAEILGIQDRGISDLLISTGIVSEEQMANFMETITEFLTEADFADMLVNLGMDEGIVNAIGITNDGFNMGLADNYAPDIDSVHDLVKGAVEVNGDIFNPTNNPHPDVVEPAAESEELLSSANSVTDATIQQAAYTSPISEIGRSTTFDQHNGGEAGDVYGAAQQTASLSTSFGSSMAGIQMTPEEVREVTQTAPAVAANNQMSFTA